MFTKRTVPTTSFAENRKIPSYLLNEDGSYLLNEDGTKILLQESQYVTTALSERTEPSTIWTKR